MTTLCGVWGWLGGYRTSHPINVVLCWSSVSAHVYQSNKTIEHWIPSLSISSCIPPYYIGVRRGDEADWRIRQTQDQRCSSVTEHCAIPADPAAQSKLWQIADDCPAAQRKQEADDSNQGKAELSSRAEATPPAGWAPLCQMLKLPHLHLVKFNSPALLVLPLCQLYPLWSVDTQIVYVTPFPYIPPKRLWKANS